MRPLLERLSILRSRQFSNAEAFLATRHIKLELSGSPADRAAFDVHYNGIYLPGIWLGYIAYGSGVTVRVLAERGDFWIHLPMQGRLQSSIGRKKVQGDSRRAVVTSPGEVNVIESAPGTARLSLCISGDALARQLESLLGTGVERALEFAPEMSLEGGFGPSLAHAMRRAAEDLEQGDGLCSPLAASRFEQSVMTALLLSQPNNYTPMLRKRATAIAPRDVARVVDYMHAHLAAPITLADLVRESGVAGRTLLKHFRDFKGVSPKRYLRHLRLARVREELQSGRAEGVARSALRWGFAHAGRFSVIYRERFGEPPSATSARRSRRAPSA